MRNTLKYILCIFFLCSCFQINKPFQNSKTNSPIHNPINSIIFIDNIIGVSEKVNLDIKKRIYNNLLKKNILTSYQYYNKNDYIVKATLIKYSKTDKIKIIFNINSSINNNMKLEIILPNDNINDSNIQNIISDKITSFIEKNIFKLNNDTYVKILKISGLKNDKKLKNVFNQTLRSLFSSNSLKIIDKKDDIYNDIKKYSSLKINFSFDEIDNERVNISVIWEIFNEKNQFIGSIKQENIIKKSVIQYVWKEISTKIIEMSLTELNMIINL
ncbi:MAG: hypothetical protein P8J46_06860 [Alphaproteobacteria bacterium]|nr:hypothetical protein [Alphaproteobacteria bacterium]